MLNHIVMWKLLDNAEGRTKQENIDLLIEKYGELKKIIPSIADAKLCRDCAGGENFDIILITHFRDEAELKAYAEHPEHKKFQALCKSVRETRTAVDYLD